MFLVSLETSGSDSLKTNMGPLESEKLGKPIRPRGLAVSEMPGYHRIYSPLFSRVGLSDATIPLPASDPVRFHSQLASTRIRYTFCGPHFWDAEKREEQLQQSTKTQVGIASVHLCAAQQLFFLRLSVKTRASWWFDIEGECHKGIQRWSGLGLCYRCGLLIHSSTIEVQTVCNYVVRSGCNTLFRQEASSSSNSACALCGDKRTLEISKVYTHFQFISEFQLELRHVPLDPYHPHGPALGWKVRTLGRPKSA